MFIFFFNDTATTEIYTLSLHDALPISGGILGARGVADPALHLAAAALADGAGAARRRDLRPARTLRARACGDRKSTRLNSSHANISYAVFCLKKKKKSNILQLPSYQIS